MEVEPRKYHLSLNIASSYKLDSLILYLLIQRIES